jgi:hypothetical protein
MRAQERKVGGERSAWFHGGGAGRFAGGQREGDEPDPRRWQSEKAAGTRHADILVEDRPRNTAAEYAEGAGF